MSGVTRGGAAIVGVAESDLGIVASGMSATDLMAQATQRALDDCGLKLGDIDAVFAATAQARMASLSLCEYLGHCAAHPGRNECRRLLLHVPSRPCACGARGQDVRCRAHRLWQHATKRRAPEPLSRPSSTLTRALSGRCSPSPAMRSRPRGTWPSSARRASNWPRSRSRRAAGR